MSTVPHEVPEHIQAEIDLDTKVKKALLGVGLVFLVPKEDDDSPFQFVTGRYNPRGLNKAAVNRMTDQFVAGECFSRSHPIRLAVSSEDVKNSTKLMKKYVTSSASIHKKVPEIEWADHVHGSELTVLAGQHRLRAAESAWPALEKRAKTATKDLAALKKQLDAENRKIAGGEGDHAKQTTLKLQIRAANDELRQNLLAADVVQRWPAELYDIGK